jgi:hypothetical protein
MKKTDTYWMAAAGSAIRKLAVEGKPFTTDAVHGRIAALRLRTNEPRRLGWLILSAHRAGLIRPTGRWLRSVRTACHHRPMREWVGV